MYKILKKVLLSPSVWLYDIEAPRIAKKAEPGQFLIVRTDEEGERIPLTIADFDRQKGYVSIVFQEIGAGTELLGKLNEGDYILYSLGGFRHLFLSPFYADQPIELTPASRIVLDPKAGPRCRRKSKL